MHREVFPQWQPPPASPGLEDGRIDVWRIDLESSPPDRMLEQAAAAGDRRPLSSRQRTVAHQAMREILGRYLDCPSDRLTLLAHPGGKPFVESPQQPSLEFNLSHSRGIALLAVTATLAVGIDVEARRALDDPVRLARRALPDEDSAQIAALPDTARTDRFLDLWTRMEARQKAIGHGIFGQPAAPALLSSFSFRPDPDLYASLSVSPATPDLALRFFDYGLL